MNLCYRKPSAFILSCCIVFSLIGCSDRGQQLGTVSGRVTLDGQPLEGASIYFDPTGGGRSSTGVTDSSGEYHLEFSHEQVGVIPGEHQVRIFSAAHAGEGAADPLLPPNYNVKTELHAIVEPGSNTIDFTLSGEATSATKVDSSK